MALVDVERTLGIHAPKLRKLIDAGLLAPSDGRGRGMPIVFDRGAVESFADLSTRLVNLTQLAGRLGISIARTRSLVDNGIIPAIHRGQDDGLASWAFDSVVVDALFERLLPTVTGTLHHAIGFESAVMAMRRRGHDFVDTMRLVLDVSLPAVDLNDGAVGFKRLRFSVEDVRRLGDGGDRRPLLPLAAAARRLGMKREAVLHLVRRGLLDRVDAVIAVEAINRFIATYITGAELARQSRTSPRALAEKLALLGVLPVTGPEIDGGRQNIYRRSDVEGMT